MRKIDLINKKVGKLTVVEKLSKRNNHGLTLWLCKCDCGKEKIVTTSNLGAGGIRSCGCLRKSINVRSSVRCSYCGKKLQRRRSVCNGKVFCNQKCYHNSKKNKINTICAYCGVKIEKKPNAFNSFERHFCDRKCRGLWQRKEIKTVCAYCGKNIIKSLWEIKRSDKSFCNPKCHYAWIAKTSSLSGENNPSWKGGISFEAYCAIWTLDEFKEEVFKRDNYKCQNPDCRHTSDRLTRHHVDYDKKNCNPNNLICLCISCNSRANIDREWHTAWYQALLKNRGIT